jgi:hypothetical protein
MLRFAYWLAALLFAGLVAAKFNPETGFTSLIRFGETWNDRRLPQLRSVPIAVASDSSGYDGQFYAQIALDPLLRDPRTASALDAPMYRARRILTPLVAGLLGFGSPWWTIQIYALLNVAGWFGLAWLLRSEISGADWKSFARWFGCLFGMGVLESVRQSLVDLPALLLLVLAVKAARRTDNRSTTLWLALANLAKESSLIAGIALLFSPRPNIGHAGRILAIAAAPLVAWSVYAGFRFHDTPGSSGAGNFTWPLWGAIQQLVLSGREVLSGNFDTRHTFALVAVVGFGLQASVLWRNRETGSSWWRIGAAYSVLLLFLGPWVWSGYWAVCRAVLPMTIAFNLLLPADRRFWPLWTLGNLTLLHAIWRFL